MPTYDYRCEGCGHKFELFQSIKADPSKTCPKCGEEKAQRVIGAGGGFIFKGSGFYITDYTRSKDYKEKAKSESSGGAAAAKSDAAPAAGTSGTGTGTGTKTPAAPSSGSSPAGSSGSGGSGSGGSGAGTSGPSSSAAA